MFEATKNFCAWQHEQLNKRLVDENDPAICPWPSSGPLRTMTVAEVGYSNGLGAGHDKSIIIIGPGQRIAFRHKNARDALKSREYRQLHKVMGDRWSRCPHVVAWLQCVGHDVSSRTTRKSALLL